MRNCKQKDCIFLKMKTGCQRCADCGIEPFVVSGDCARCYACENIPDACRWDNLDFKLKEKKKVMEIIR